MTTEIETILEKAERGKELTREEHKLLTDEGNALLGYGRPGRECGCGLVDGPDGLHCIPPPMVL